MPGFLLGVPSCILLSSRSEVIEQEAPMSRPGRDRAPSGSSIVEWVGGIAPLPTLVTGEGEPYRPETLMWIDEEGAILGSDLGRPGELLETAGEHLLGTIEEPLCGTPHAPDRIRVASPDLADVLRGAAPSIDVVCGPTPEIDEAVASLVEMMNAASDAESPYLTGSNRPDACASLCRAAAGLYRAAPWEVVPSDGDVLFVTIEALGIHDAVISVIGQMGENHGLVLFQSLADFGEFVAASCAPQLIDEVDLPTHLSLTFDPPHDIPPGLRREIEEHGWEIADERAQPWPFAVEGGVSLRPPAPEEVAYLEVVALALPLVLREPEPLLDAWEGGERVERTVAVPTSTGEVSVTFETPESHEDVLPRPEDDLLGQFYDLEQDDDWKFEFEGRRPLQDALLERFEAAPEGRGVEDPGLCDFTMDLAAGYLGVTVASLQADDLDEVVFDLIPRKVSIPASEARSIIEANRAFFTFLGRDAGLPQADACLQVLGPGAVKRLEDALSDSSRFGMAKSFLMAAEEEGYDVSTTEGLQEWTEVWNRRMAPFPHEAPPHAADPTESTKTEKDRQQRKKSKKKKKKRKQARKARRKSAKKRRGK
jgi:hypothetical protein